MKPALSALVVALHSIFSTATASLFNATFWHWGDLQIPFESGLTTAYAMEMDLWGGVRPTDSPAEPISDYDEDLIVSLITEIYHTLLRLGPLSNDDIVWPPEGGHQLNTSMVEEEGFETDPKAVSLMKRLPVCLDTRSEIMPNMGSINYVLPNLLLWSRMLDERDVFWDKDGLPMIPAPPMTVMLFRDNNELMPVVVLDLAENTIRQVHFAEYLQDAYTETEQGQNDMDYRCNYKNWPAMSAPEYLRSILKNLRQGIWIPSRSGFLMPLDPREPELFAEVSVLRRLLMEVYGWPEDFQEEAWKRDVLGSWKESVAEWEEMLQELLNGKRPTESGDGLFQQDEDER